MSAAKNIISMITLVVVSGGFYALKLDLQIFLGTHIIAEKLGSSLVVTIGISDQHIFLHQNIPKLDLRVDGNLKCGYSNVYYGIIAPKHC